MALGAAVTVIGTSLAAAVLMASPADTPARGSQGAPAASADSLRPVPTYVDRTGPRATLTASPTPSPTEPNPPSAKPVKPRATPAQPRPTPRPPAKTLAPRSVAPEPITISGYRVCIDHPQPCIDSGALTLYGNGGTIPILAGHNFQGWQWLSRVATGREVRVTTGMAAGRYRVYAHSYIPRQTGALPDFGRAALVLQSCEGPGTGFTLLEHLPSS